MRRLRLVSALGFLAVSWLVASCESLQDFVGVWQGPISSDPQLQQGFGHQATLALTVSALEGTDAQILVQVPGVEAPLRYEAIRRASADALGAMSLPGDSLRSYMGYLRPPEQEPYLFVMTLYSQNRIEARLIRGPDDAYGVFRLRKR